MPAAIKAPSGRQIWKAVREELTLNLYPMPFSTLPPSVFRIYLHPDDFDAVEPIAPRIVDQIQRALTAEVDRMNSGLRRSAARVFTRLLDREQMPPIEVPPGGWEVHVQADRNGELQPGELGIVSTLAMPAPAEFTGTPTTRIVKSVVAAGRRTASTTDVDAPAEAAAATPAAREATPSKPTAATTVRATDGAPRARLTYEDEQGPHVFMMKKDSLSVGRGGSSAWVDVQIVGSPKVSREHFRLRYDAAVGFFIQDVSLWGTSIDGVPIPAAVKGSEGVAEPGPEHALPAKATIALAGVMTIDFEAIAER